MRENGKFVKNVTIILLLNFLAVILLLFGIKRASISKWI